MKFSFDHTDDLFLEDIPDDLMETVATVAAGRQVSEEDIWREILTLWSKEQAV